MALSQSSFLARHPEFASVATSNPELVSVALDDANAEIDEDVWGDQAPRGQALHAACSLARSPFGQQSALLAEDKIPVYAPELERLRKVIGGANRAVLP